MTALPVPTDFAVKAWEAGGPIALAAVTVAIIAVIWAARREFHAPPARDPVAEAIKAQTQKINDLAETQSERIEALADLISKANEARGRHEAATDTKLAEHQRRLDVIDRKLDRVKE